MADRDEPDNIWDEYDWERFLQQQDRKTEKYMELLERYIDDPERDQIIDPEMGWSHLLDESGQEWAETVEEDFPGELEDDEPPHETAEEEEAEMHPLYAASFA